MDDIFDSMQEEWLWPTIEEDVADIFYMDPDDEEDEEDRESNEPDHEEADWYGCGETEGEPYPPFPVLDASCRTIY
jgi:hypothetical protein